MSSFIPSWLGKKIVRNAIIGIIVTLVLVLTLFLGIYANMHVMAANDGHMPVAVDPSTTNDPAIYIEQENAKLTWMSDIFPMRIEAESPTWFGRVYHRTIDFLTGDEGPGLYYFSFGDLLIWVGSRPLVPISLVFGLFTLVVVLRAKQNGHPFFAEFRHRPGTSACARRLIDSIIMLALVAIFASIIYGSWLAR